MRFYKANRYKDIRDPQYLSRSHENKAVLQSRDIFETLHRYSCLSAGDDWEQPFLNTRLHLPRTHAVSAQPLPHFWCDPGGGYVIHNRGPRPAANPIYQPVRVAQLN